tara:strand:- start:15 stop:344 length:330 start_codon:yes stop_codon:yes gene_type:complete
MVTYITSNGTKYTRPISKDDNWTVKDGGREATQINPKNICYVSPKDKHKACINLADILKNNRNESSLIDFIKDHDDVNTVIPEGYLFMYKEKAKRRRHMTHIKIERITQ